MSNMNSTATIDVKVRGVEQLQNLQNKLQATTGIFDNLKTALGGIALGSFIANTIQGAAALDDLSASSGIALQSVIGFSKALQQAGGNAEASSTGIARFSNFMDDLSNGSKTAYDTILQLGIGLDDLNGLDTEGRFRKIIEGLGGMEAGTKRTALGMSIFGKSFATVDFEKLNNDIDGFISRSEKNVSATKAAADAEDKFALAVSNLKSSLLIAIEPITQFIAKLDPSKVEAMASTIANLGTAFLAIKASSAALKVISEIGLMATSSQGALTKLASALGFASSIESFKGGAASMKREFAELGSTIDRALHSGKFSGADSGLKLLGNSLFGLTKGFVRMIPLLGQAFMAFELFNGAIAALTGRSIGEWLDAASTGFQKLIADNFPALAGMINSIRDALGMAPSPAEQEKKGQGTQNKLPGANELADPYKAQRAAIADVVEQFDKQNKKTAEQLSLETSLIGLSKEEQDVKRAQFEIAQRYQETIDKLIQSRENLTAAELRAGLGVDYDKQIKAATAAKEAAMAQAKSVNDANNKQLNLDEVRKFGQQSEINAAKQLQTIRDNIAKSTMGELDRRKYDIEAQQKASAQEKIASEEQRLGRRLNESERQMFVDQAMKNTKELQDAEEESYLISRKWSTGWTNAFKEYADNATNAAAEAKRVFDIMAQGMEDALMGFIKKGKFEWKNFVQLMVDELLRSQIRQLIGNLGSGMSSAASGIGGSIGKLLGFASGGIIPTNGPVIVGERGPELLFGAAGSQVVPNSGLGGGNNIVYNISAVDAMSFKAMLAKDPTFLYAVTEQGRRSLPGGR